MLSKIDVRNTIRKQRQSMVPGQVASISESIIKHVIEFKPFLMAQTVALYLPVDNEVDTSPLLNHHKILEKKLCLPVVRPENKLGFSQFKPGDSLQSGVYGILEPCNKDWLDIGSIDMFLLPLVGFDAQGTRLGYGGGYYDRALSHCKKNAKKPIVVGLAFQFQEVAQLPCADHDVPLHYIVTENGVRSFL
ncbi:MAG: 5-formyltetrahydrofolate cyclo-ligase [Magnetococcales bacterium]|nr:5-formyltetrahydrofolate cyclo-ligase [Magnetococcales bacterium]